MASRDLGERRAARLGLGQLDLGTVDRLTHYLFRYPAKFHPPVVRALLERYTEVGDVVLDPFCGSGTALVEAVVMGRSAFGIDVDPLAVEITRVKTHRYQPARLRARAEELTDALAKRRRPKQWYEQRAKRDLGKATFADEVAPLEDYVPAIPNLHHWFRRYVIVDLAEIRATIEELDCGVEHRRFFDIVFASIIRNASNADPVPVSGLEYTSHMKRRDAEGRVVDPYTLFDVALRKALDAVEAFAAAASPGAFAEAEWGDATDIRAVFDSEVTAVLTSPPYHGAVDYYRRHQLEQFWLGLTNTQEDRLALLDQYIGRPRVPQRDRFVQDGVLSTALAKEWEDRIRSVDSERADAFRHYMVAMTAVFEGLADALDRRGVALFVVGHSTWNGAEIPTSDLFDEIAGDAFRLDELLSYPVKNRYMSYDRNNGADISKEYVLVMRRT